MNSSANWPLQPFRLPDAPRLVLKEFRKEPMSLTEVQGTAAFGLTTEIPKQDAYLVQLRLITCRHIQYFCEGRALEGIDTRAGVIQFHDLRRSPVAVMHDPFHVLHMHLPVAALRDMSAEMNAPPVDALQLGPSEGVHDPLLRNLFRALRPAIDSPREASRLVVGHIAQAFAAHIVRRYGGVVDQPDGPRGGLAPWQARRALEQLDAVLDGEIALGQLAVECGLSVRHFGRAFQQSMGLPPHRYLLKRRVERAKELLLSSPLSLLEIALACGFADQSHFTRVFRAAVGATPGAWRRIRQNH